MQKKTKSILIILVLILICCCYPVSASTIQFVNTAGIGNGTLTITASNGSVLATLNPMETFEVSNSTPYHLDYQPEGLFSLKNEVILGVNFTSGEVTPPQFNMLHFLLNYFSQLENIRNLILVILLILLVVMAL
jgi:hypothetical protein